MEGIAGRFTVCSLWPLGQPSVIVALYLSDLVLPTPRLRPRPLSWRGDFNPYPPVYKTGALPLSYASDCVAPPQRGREDYFPALRRASNKDARRRGGASLGPPSCQGRGPPPAAGATARF